MKQVGPNFFMLKNILAIAHQFDNSDEQVMAQRERGCGKHVQQIGKDRSIAELAQCFNHGTLNGYFLRCELRSKFGNGSSVPDISQCLDGAEPHPLFRVSEHRLQGLHSSAGLKSPQRLNRRDAHIGTGIPKERKKTGNGLLATNCS
ncbi:MAG: hypothetical protein D6704_08455 [Nitrospirae bacterium]|nr:MAG: hypothetical protein D6704_08455 [Nitrospirota bacterium]